MLYIVHFFHKNSNAKTRQKKTYQYINNCSRNSLISSCSDPRVQGLVKASLTEEIGKLFECMASGFFSVLTLRTLYKCT